jgi:hypothetical protein
MPSPIVVYFPINTTIDPSGVEVFGETVTTSDRIIDLKNIVSVSSLQTFFKYQEDPTNRDNAIVSTMKANDAGLVSDLSGCLAGVSDVDRASYVWWSGIANTDPNYSNITSGLFHYTSVYEVLLSQIAYDLFGHPLAKAGIANDTDIISHFNSENLARSLVNDLESLSTSNLGVIYQQMVAQDPSRFNVQDSTAGATGPTNPLPNSLPFQIGDTLRFEITLSPYTVSSWGGAVDTTGNNYNISKSMGLIGTTFPSKTYTLNMGVGVSLIQPFTWNVVNSEYLSQTSIKCTVIWAWGASGGYSSQGYGSGIFVEFTAAQTNKECFCGLSETKSVLYYPYADYGFLMSTTGSSGIYKVRRLDNQYAYGSYTTNTVFKLTYDGSHVRYYVDNVLVYTMSRVSTSLLYLNVSFGVVNAQVNNIRYGIHY